MDEIGAVVFCSLFSIVFFLLYFVSYGESLYSKWGNRCSPPDVFTT